MVKFEQNRKLITWNVQITWNRCKYKVVVIFSNKTDLETLKNLFFSNFCVNFAVLEYNVHGSLHRFYLMYLF